ncbi:MAG: glycosyltransferase family 4 protein [Anaerolineaceae bacterium]
MPESMGVLQVIRGLDVGGKSGGSDKYGLELSLALHRAGVNVAVYCFNTYSTETEEENIRLLQSEGIPLFLVGGRSTVQKLFSRKVLEFCRSHNIMITHSHFPVGNLFAIRLKVHKIARKIVRTAHISKEWGSGPVAWVCRVVFSKGLFPLLTDVQVGVSRSVTDQLNSYCGAKLAGRTARTIYNGISSSWFAGEGRAEPVQPNHLVIGAVGLLIDRKGYDLLVMAMPKILQSFPNARLVIIGEGVARGKLEKLAEELKIGEKVSLVGKQTQVREWFEQMDLFVLPSWVEGFPTVILESMACRVPVIASDIAGSNELVLDGQTGWLVPPGSAEHLAERVIHAFSCREERVRVREQAYHWAKNFTIETACEQYIEIYRELVKE